MYRIERSGPRMEHWGILSGTFFIVDLDPLMAT